MKHNRGDVKRNKAIQLLRIGDLHSAVLAAPSVERRLRDSVLTAQVDYRPLCFSLLQNSTVLSLSKQTFPDVVLLAPFAFGRTLFLTGVDLGRQANRNPPKASAGATAPAVGSPGGHSQQ